MESVPGGERAEIVSRESGIKARAAVNLEKRGRMRGRENKPSTSKLDKHA